MNEKKEIILIGLGKMGFGIMENLLGKKFRVGVYDANNELLKKAIEKGAEKISSLEEIKLKFSYNRVLIVCIPSGETGKIIEKLKTLLEPGDIVIDLGNSFYRDSKNRAEFLKEKRIKFIDAGISGGVEGARKGGCLMIGGEKETFEKIEYVFEALSKNNSYQYLGKSGSGHLVKGYHNLVEYGFLQALAEGLICVKEISEKEGININLVDVCKIWKQGSILESRLVKDAERALEKNPELEGVSGSVFGQTQKEMEKLLEIAKETGIKSPSCEAAVNERIESQKNPSVSGKIINVIRNVFGGHEEWRKQ